MGKTCNRHSLNVTGTLGPHCTVPAPLTANEFMRPREQVECKGHSATYRVPLAVVRRRLTGLSVVLSNKGASSTMANIKAASLLGVLGLGLAHGADVSIRAGVPTLITPFIVDQFMYAAWVEG